MAPSTPGDPDDPTASAANDTVVESVRRVLQSRTLSALRGASFWSAVVLPFVAVAVLASGVESTVEWLLFVALLVLNGFSLYLGHSYREP